MANPHDQDERIGAGMYPNPPAQQPDLIKTAARQLPTARVEAALPDETEPPDFFVNRIEDEQGFSDDWDII